MSPLGENLRREREMRGVSLEEISEATKISIRFLEAIENEEFAKLPGGIFTRSFIRTYARYLGLDDERILAEYQLTAQPRAEFDLPRLAATRPSPPSRPGAKRTPLIAVLVAIVMLAGGYALFRYSRRAAEMPASASGASAVQASAPSTASAPQPAPASDAAVPAAVPGAPQASPGTEATAGASTAQPNAAAPNPSTGPTGSPGTAASARPLETDTGLTLQVAATDKAWVAVDADGKTVLQKSLNPNEVETLKAHDSFDVTTGNAQGIVLTLNGVTLKPLGRRGEVKSVHLTREDLKGNAP